MDGVERNLRGHILQLFIGVTGDGFVYSGTDIVYYYSVQPKFTGL